MGNRLGGKVGPECSRVTEFEMLARELVTNYSRYEMVESVGDSLETSINKLQSAGLLTELEQQVLLRMLAENERNFVETIGGTRMDTALGLAIAELDGALKASHNGPPSPLRKKELRMACDAPFTERGQIIRKFIVDTK